MNIQKKINLHLRCHNFFSSNISNKNRDRVNNGKLETSKLEEKECYLFGPFCLLDARVQPLEPTRLALFGGLSKQLSKSD